MARKHPGTMPITINGKEIQVDIDLASMVDPLGYVFHYHNGIYRMINKNNIDPVKEFLSVGNIDKIFDVGLVQTEIAKDIKGNVKFPFVLKHHKIEFLSYWMEWTPDMFRDAMQMLVNLGQELAKVDYTLIDNHTYNVFFDYTRPVYVDLGSVSKLGLGFPSMWVAYFRTHWMTRFAERSNLTLEGFDDIRNRNDSDRNKFFDELRGWLSTATFDYNITEWAGYGQKPFDFDNLPPKQKVVYDILNELKDEMETVVDIGANQGIYSEVAADLGYKVVAFDIDETSISKLYNRNKGGERKILPLIFDFSKPTEAHGLYSDGYLSGEQRCACDISMALALVHHISYKQRVPFDTTAEYLDKFTKKVAIVEFIPATDKHIAGWPNRPAEYSQENFIKSMMKYFDSYEVRKSNPDPRTMLIFRKEER